MPDRIAQTLIYAHKLVVWTACIAMLMTITGHDSKAKAESPPQPGPEGDFSGHGAVLCTGSILLGIKFYIEQCHPNEDQEIREEIESGIKDIKSFVLKNSPEKTAWMERNWNSTETLPASDLEAICRSQDAARMLNDIRSKGREGLHAMIADTIWVPRPAVMNPCL